MVDDNKGTAQLGRLMLVWAVVLGLAIWAMDVWLERKNNPNKRAMLNDAGVLALKANQQHQYMALGLINGIEVVFLLDTGASHVSVPANIAKQAGLVPKGELLVGTANGVVVVERTTIENLSLGGITLYKINGSINPHMHDDVVLLGMSALKYFAIQQQGDTLLLSPAKP